MSRPRQGRRILWLLWALTAMGLAAVVITIGLVGWTLTAVRGQRARLTAEQDRLDEASQALRRRTVENRMAFQTALDETVAMRDPPNAVAGLAQWIRTQLSAQRDSALRQALVGLDGRISHLADAASRAAAWRTNYDAVWEDLSQQRTLGLVRNQITQLRGAVEMFEGRRRLDEALKHKRWRAAAGEEANRLAQSILQEQSHQQSQNTSDFKAELAECARLVELLAGEEQFDNLADLKDNKLKPVLDRLTSGVASFRRNESGADALKPQAVEELETALFGQGYRLDEAHQNIQPGRGGLFQLRHDALRLRREREKLKAELAGIFPDLEAANAQFAQSIQVRTTALTQQMEQGLAAGWRQMLVFGGGCSAVFCGLAWFISRGVAGQVNALEQARAEAVAGRQTTQKLMIEQQAAAAELAVALKGLRASEQRFRMLSASAPIGIFEADAAGANLYSNPAWEKITGLSAADTAGQGWERAIHPADAAEVFAGWSAATGQGREFDREFRLLTTTGEVRWVHSRSAPMRSEAGDLIGHVGTVEDITERKRAEAELEKAHRELMRISRQAGMAEVATGVLHNVGNVLNSVNVSATLIADQVRKSKSGSLGKLAALLREHAAELGAFLTTDPKGKQLPGYVGQLSEHLAGEQQSLLQEAEALRKNIEHIKEIVAMQQNYAKVSGAAEIVKVSELVEDALRMNDGAMTRHEVQVIREFEDVPPITVDRHKVFQILINLLRNAKYACDDSGRLDKQITIAVANGDGRVQVVVSDNGIGIPAENLTRIFAHGFTTRKGGHGFGLHSGALAAKEMGGSLIAHSDGCGNGATFTLELPLQQPRKFDA